MFATQIDLMKDGELVLGLSNAPALKELTYAEKGFGSYCNESKTQVSSIEELDKSYMLFGGIHFFKNRNLLKNLISLCLFICSTYLLRFFSDISKAGKK